MRARLITCVLLPIALVAACTLPDDERAVPINPVELGDLANTTTTTTTSTTTTTTTTLPTDGSSATTPTPPTTAPPPLLETAPVDFFYTIGFSNDLARLTRELNVDASIAQVIEQLESPLPDLAELSLRTAVRRDLIDSWEFDRGTITVSFAADELRSLPEAALERAVAQIVLTLTSFRIRDAGSIGRVRFEVEGEPFSVFVPFLGGQSEPGQEVAFTDFAALIQNSSAADSTTSVPPTTSPATASPDSTVA